MSRLVPTARRTIPLAALLLIPAAALGDRSTARGDDELVVARARLDDEHSQRLFQLAAKCDELGMKEQASITRDWFLRRDPQRQYIFLPPDSGLDPPNAEAPQLVRFWQQKFVELRQQQADSLFALAERAVVEKEPTRAYQWLHESLRENPDHPQARQVLGYQRSGGQWLTPFRQPRAEAARAPYPQFGWGRRAYWRIETGHYRIATSHSAEAGLALGRQMEDLYAVWRQLFFRYWSSGEALAARLAGGPSLEPPKLHNIVLFRDRDEYLAQLARAAPQIDVSVGYYLDQKRTAYFYVDDGQNRATWLHEGAHQLFQETLDVPLRAGETANFWVIEGAALYMESLSRRDGYCTVGGSDANRLQYARYRALNEGYYLPLEKLARYGRQSLQGDEQIRALYSQIAGLTAFLMDFDRGRHRTALVDLLRHVYRGRRDDASLETLTGVPYSQLDAQYHQFLQVTDDDLEHLSPPPQVHNLCLGHTAVTDQGLARLAEHGELEWLDLAAAKITDAGVSRLKTAKQLKQLNLEQTPITDKALEIVGSLRQLEELDLSATRITDAGLKHLSGLTNLNVLWLTSTSVSDAGLEHLKNLSRLEMLETSGTAITPSGLRRLKTSLPALRDRP